nr:MAG TPA: hypothetical protein [Bacteriophage sp.]
MERILAPRGGGRTYAICEYAVKNNCNILVPMGGTAILCAQDYIKEIARNLDIQYYGYRVDHQCLIVDLQSIDRGEYSIYVLTTTCLPDNYRGRHLEDKPLVVDDIDRCFKFMCFPNVRIDACSLMTYNPSEVAFTTLTTPQKVPQDECVCDSLL